MTPLREPIAITMGDPSGIGPEIVAMALARRAPPERHVVIGSASVMGRAVNQTGINRRVRPVRTLDDLRFEPSDIEVLEAGEPDTLPDYGIVSATSGRMAFDAIIRGIDCALAGRVRALVTAPIHKEALSAAGLKYPGHTEILADYAGTEHAAMMLANDDICTVLVTVHCALADAIRNADYQAQMRAIRLAHQGAVALGFETPRIAVAGLNPHAGEGGRFGREEIEIIRPAIEAARKDGLDVSGPWPGDTVFMQARQGRFDVVVAQYHDQGLIPVKYLGLEKGVNITLGLPFVRTSPDHGTAFDIAGKGIADPSSLVTALDYANKLTEQIRGKAA